MLFLYNSIDDFVMSNLKNYSGRELKSAEDAGIDLSLEDTEEQKTKRTEEQDKKAQEEQEGGEEGGAGKKTSAGAGAIPDDEPFCAWLKETLGAGRVTEIKTTTRLSDSPAIITDHESGAVRRMMKMVVRHARGEEWV